jgi:bifunctional DNA-binding transcriptional regulator/antitoxin component of YhaV-PrlF toxin-antitoxin module
MRTATISRGGQISIPADIRHRWGSTRLILVDHGDSLVIRPIPADPIRAAMGSLRSGGLTTDEIREQMRRDEVEIEERKYGSART